MSPADDSIRQRARESFAAYVRPIAHLLEDPMITDIMLNAAATPDAAGEVWIDRVGVGLEPTDVKIFARESELLIRDVGKSAGGEHLLDAKHPVLSCRAALGQFRFEALLQPAVITPTFTIRKYVKRDVRFSDYVESGEVTVGQFKELGIAVAVHGATVLLGGETASGKTTMLNALLHEAAADRSRRLLVIEDTPELDCPPGASTRIEVSPGSAFGYREGVVSALRQRPNTIVLGELRQPDDAMEALRAWNTGHQGFGTLHAPSCTGMLWELYSLVRQCERGRHVEQRTIARTVQIVVHLRRERGRRIIDVSRVKGWDETAGEFVTERIE